MRRHHLDIRADRLVEDGVELSPDTLLSTKQLAERLGTSKGFLEKLRCRGGGPAWVAVSPRMVRYRWGDVQVWLAERTRLREEGYRAA